MIYTAVRAEARTTPERAASPGCGCRPGRRHGSYLRFPHDLPTAGKSVVVSLRVRKSVCEEEPRERTTFAEQLPGPTRRFERRTEQPRPILAPVGLALASRAGTRMTDAFKVPVSRNTPLRPITSLPDP
ncbi:transposase family protein [Kitasatospora sp. NPDC056138]|uniref:transposase family protein n=1 Tax=Kitasatospora sp. NPDC056138 TaxID=3345724 RepID=UPI0035D662D5